jgi:hypothetical protein
VSPLSWRNAAGWGPAAALVGGVLACGAPSPHVLPAATATTTSGAEAAPHPAGDPNRGHPARSYALVDLPAHVLGPFTARASERELTAWFGPAEGDKSGQDLIAIVLGNDAGPLGPMHSLVHVPVGPDLMVVRRAAEASRGWTVGWSALLDRGEVLTVLGVTADGSPKGAPTEIHRTSDHVVWLDLLPTPRGALVVWAEETTSGNANVLVDALDPAGKPRGVPMRVARGVRRWQAASAGTTIGLALVVNDSEHSVASSASSRSPSSDGDLTWQALDEDGRPKGDGLRLAKGASVGSDVEVVAFESGWLLAWTDLSNEDPQVMLATIDAKAQLRGPNAAFEAGGASVLTALASSGGRAAMAWTEPHRRQGETQVLGVGIVSSDGSSIAKPVAAFEIGVGSPPELVATDTSFALLAPARACWAESSSHSCGGPFAPTFIRFGPELDAVQSEPLLVGDPKRPASVGWGLSCAVADRCFALAASGENPTPVFSVDLRSRTSPFATPLVPPPPADSPRLGNVRTVASGTRLEDLAATRLGDETFVATLGAETEGRRSKRRHTGSAISTFTIENDGTSLAEPRRISTRAESVGGVSVASGEKRSDGAIVAWISGATSGTRSTGEVRLSQVSESGRVLRSAHLGSADGDASRVALAWAGDGWLVAWVDGRDGGGQVYATKVGRELQHTARSERVTRSAVGATDIALAVRGDLAWIAWGDARESPREGIADIYATTLHVADASPAGEETRVLATARHSRSPVLAAVSDSRALIAWIEDAPAGVDELAVGMIGSLDRRANVIRPPVELPLAGPGQPASIALASAEGEVHAVVARSGIGGGTTLDGIRLGPTGAPVAPPWPLVVLEAPASVNVSLAMAGDGIVYSDVVPVPGQRRIRRAEIAWRP